MIERRRLIEGKMYITSGRLEEILKKETNLRHNAYYRLRKNGLILEDHVEHNYMLKRKFPWFLESRVPAIIEMVKEYKKK